MRVVGISEWLPNTDAEKAGGEKNRVKYPHDACVDVDGAPSGG